MIARFKNLVSVIALSVAVVLLCCSASFAESLGSQTLYAFNPSAPTQPWTLFLTASYDAGTYTYSLSNPSDNAATGYTNYITDFELTIQGLTADDVVAKGLEPTGWTVDTYDLGSSTTGDNVRIQWTGNAGAGLAAGKTVDFQISSPNLPSSQLNTVATASSFWGYTYGPGQQQAPPPPVPECSTIVSAMGILGGVLSPMLLRRKTR